MKTPVIATVRNTTTTRPRNYIQLLRRMYSQERRGNIQITRSSSLHSPPTHHLCQWNGNTSRGFCERPKRIHPLTKYVCRRENGNDGQVGNIGEKCGQKDSELLSGVHHHLPGNGRQNPETGKLLHWQILTNYLRTDCNVPDWGEVENEMVAARVGG